ncbi:MAG: LAGLIDADG family homing endonuclease [Bacteroidales bacterium]|nr:LAGLIDADG family homing endonuclease [Bacteroidales bacterium]
MIVLLKKTKDLSSVDKNSIANDYKSNNITIKGMQEKYNVSSRTLYSVLKELNIPKKVRPFLDNKTFIKATTDILNGMSYPEVSAKYDVSYVQLYTYAKKNGLDFKTNKGRVNHFNQSYFKTIDTEEKAYWFGFLYADGGISKSNAYDKEPVRLTINLSIKDRDLLELFLIAIGASNNIKIKDYIPKGTYSENPMCKVSLNSIKLCRDMTKNGFRLKKINSNEIVFNYIPDEFTHHFIRGYFDGDGSVYGHYAKISGSLDFLSAIEGILKEKNIESSSLKTYKDKRKDKSFTLSFTRSKEYHKLYEYLYHDANVYLERKKNLFVV